MQIDPLQFTVGFIVGFVVYTLLRAWMRRREK